MERAKGFEPSTFSLATRRSTTELCPLSIFFLQFNHINNRLQDEMLRIKNETSVDVFKKTIQVILRIYVLLKLAELTYFLANLLLAYMPIIIFDMMKSDNKPNFLAL